MASTSDNRCWNHFANPNPNKGRRFAQCKNVATWFYYDDSLMQSDPDVMGAMSCQLCDDCYDEETLKPEAQTVFDPKLFRRRKNWPSMPPPIESGAEFLERQSDEGLL